MRSSMLPRPRSAARFGEIHHEHVAGATREYAADHVGRNLVVDLNFDLVAGFEPVASPAQMESSRSNASWSPSKARARGRFGEHIDADQRDGAAGIGKQGVILDARMDAERIGKRGQAREHFRGHAARRGHLKIRAAGQRFHGGVERSRGGVAGEFDGEDRRDSQGDGEHGERGSHRLTTQRTKNQAAE